MIHILGTNNYLFLALQCDNSTPVVIVRSGTDLVSLLILLFFFLLVRPLQKSLRLRSFKSDRGEI